MADRFLHLARHGEALADGPLTDRGRQQAAMLGQRLASLPISAIHHSPLLRAVETTRVICEHLPGVPVESSELVGDYIPPVPDPQALPDVYARFLDGLSTEDYATGAELANAAIQRYGVPATAGGADPASHELIVTHNFLIGWFIRHALDAPEWRWLGLNQGNCALTTILYRPDRPPALVLFNDMGHLPAALRWTGFPPDQHV
ncbi:histidine phosphatase family protein [Polymorphospora lycopeni]|uniref:Histidine phosphatase family protein n=1 Tax=Polymorphospora lycopeni TaxID=3140240 RepID=A0ABV5CVA9_9ACTN